MWRTTPATPCATPTCSPQNRLFNWTHVGHFRPDQNLLMHSVMYRTQVLRDCGMVLPKHTFYVDNIFVYMVETYINGNFETFRRLYHELNKDARRDFMDFLLSEVEPTYWREILKQII